MYVWGPLGILLPGFSGFQIVCNIKSEAARYAQVRTRVYARIRMAHRVYIACFRHITCLERLGRRKHQQSGNACVRFRGSKKTTKK
jgi:hypothetical protein